MQPPKEISELLHFVMNHRIIILFSVFFWLLSQCNSPENQPSPLNDFQAPFYYGVFDLPEENPLTAEGVALGRMLFYETSLSSNNQVSCATCHQQEKAFTDGRAFAIGVSGKPTSKSSMPLNNLLWGPKHFFWDGRASNLEEQSLIPIQNPDEMGLEIEEAVEKLGQLPIYPPLFKAAFGTDEITPSKIAMALASFQRILISQNSKYDKYLRGETELSKEELLGKELFMTHPDASVGLRGGNCADCHSQFLTSGFATGYDGFKNNGLDNDENLEGGLAYVTGKESDWGKFKVPSLRNIALTAPYMHDGRFKTLEEVIDHYDHQIKDSKTLDPLMREASNQKPVGGKESGFHLTADEKKAILMFLQTLTDEDFITNKDFNDPHH
jgi:cytochrome c peroxidase